MANLILCHNKKADNPYEITRVHLRIYTLEELCYYLCKNLYLVDHTLINEKLCSWIKEELDLDELAGTLRKLVEEEYAVEKFVLRILEASKIYSENELMHVQNVLEKLKTQKDVEREKIKADNLLESGEIAAAILVYKSILREERDETMDDKFYGTIYGNLGAAYGRSLLYEEAANMYEKSYEISQNSSVIMAYLYACSFYMSKNEYQVLLDKSEILMQTDKRLTDEKAKIIPESTYKINKKTLNEWKQEYRKL